MKIILLFLLFIAFSYYIWTNNYEGFEEDTNVLTTNSASTGITTIERYKDPMCKNLDEYIYCVDGKIECEDVLGGTVNTLSRIGSYISGDTLTGCSSYINKINLSDYKDETGGVMATGVYFDLSMCTKQKPWRVGGDKDGKLSFKGCFDTELNATNILSSTIVIYKKGDKVLIKSSNIKLNGIQTFLKVLDVDKNSFKFINDVKYYKATVIEATSGNYTINLGPPGNIQTITGVQGSELLKDSLFNQYSNDFYSDLKNGSHPRPKCKGGLFTSCASKPPFTIVNGIYVPTHDAYDTSYNMPSLQKDAIIGAFNLTNPSGIIDKSNILEYNYYDTQLVSNPFIKCIADNGTNVGDKVCCGQDDTLKNTKYICPEEVPNCKGYSKDDNVYGICT